VIDHASLMPSTPLPTIRLMNSQSSFDFTLRCDRSVISPTVLGELTVEAGNRSPADASAAIRVSAIRMFDGEKE
jgi:hypothetical protein